MLCLAAGMLFFCCAAAQVKTVDSLRRLLEDVKQDTTKISLHYQVAAELSGYDETAAIKYLETGYKLAKGIGNKFYIARYYLAKGHLFYDVARYDTARMSYDSAILLYDELINATGPAAKKDIYRIDRADCLTGKGLLLAKFYKYQESIQYYLEAIASIENIKGNMKDSHLATLYGDIASNYYDLEQFENALKYDKQGLLYLNRSTNPDRYVIGHLFVADDFNGLLQFDSASAYLEKVRAIVLQLNRPNVDVRFYYILGGIYRKKKEWDRALTSYQKAREAAAKMNDDFQIVNSEEGLAACYLNTGDFGRARTLAVNVLNESKRLSVPIFKMQALQLLADVE